MPFTKFASFEVSEILEVKGTTTKSHTASLDKIADFEDYRTEDGYMYARIRAISSRVNKNNDGWPSVELAGGKDEWDKLAARREASGGSGFVVEADSKAKYGFSTFIGKPIFVDHNNSDPKRTRGVIADAKFYVEDAKTAAGLDSYYSSDKVDPEHLPPSHVELLLEIDAKQFPKLAKAILAGAADADDGIDGFSMGCDVDYSKCSHCGHTASSPDEYCSHIVMKGGEQTIESGVHEGKTAKSYENCYGIKFFEISAVFEPADETALTKEVRASVHKEADGPKPIPPEPQSDHIRAPEDVDTLRQERICPLCGSDVDGDKCDVCGYEFEPEGFQNPDLERAREVDPGKDQVQNELTVPPDEDMPPPAGGEGQSYLKARKQQPTSSVISDMRWAPRVNPKLAKYMEASTKPSGDEPDETVTSDQTTPVTSAFRTATQLIEAAKRNHTGDNMSDKRVAADPADPSGKAKKRVDTTGVGGVDEASAEAASKADAQVDVTGKGGVIQDSNAAASAPGESQSVEQTSDNGGFDKTKTTDDSGPTKTFDNSNEPESAVTDKAFPTAAAVQAGDAKAFPGDSIGGGSAKSGTDPADPIGKADERVDVLSPVTSPDNNSGKTKTWSGTDGNGVTKQQPPVTREVTQSGGINAHIVAAIKQADAELELGLISPEDKYNRLAELAELSPEELDAEARVTSRVKTAGLARTPKESRRVPSFSQSKKVTAATEPEPDVITDAESLDYALFTR